MFCGVSMSDEAEIAGRLSEAQKFVVMWLGQWGKAPRHELESGRFLSTNIGKELDALGVTSFARNSHGNRQRKLTDLGLAVRAHLMEHPNAE